LAQQAVALYKDAGPSSDESRRGVRRWLDEHPR
jgi:hypothetical protein